MNDESGSAVAPETLRIETAEGRAFAELLPRHGGMLNRLCLDAGQGPMEVIAGIHDMKALADNRQYRGVHLFPFPNRLNNGSYQFAGRRYQFPINESELNNALHGLLYRINPDRMLRPSEDQLQWVFNYNGELSYYPFPFCVAIGYQLPSHSELSVRFSVINTGKTKLPFGIGWHPYFQLQQPIDDIALQLPRVQRVAVDDRMLPTGEKQDYNDFSALRRIADTHFDDCFEIQESHSAACVRLWSEKQRIGLEFSQESSEHGCRFLQICTTPDRQSIAIEPMSCSVDAFNSKDGLRILEPGESFSTRFGVKLVTA